MAQSDNIVSRVSRVYIAHKSFTNDAGDVVKYDRLITEFQLNGEPYEIEAKLNKDSVRLLELVDDLDAEQV